MSDPKTQVNVVNLKPCPFCGYADNITTTAMGESWISCPDCGANGGMRESEAGAIEVWNKRPQSRETDAK